MDRGGDLALDMGPPSGELLLRLPMVRGHPSEQLVPSARRLDPADVVLASEGASVLSLVVPEVEVPSSAEVADPRAASDLHRSYLQVEIYRASARPFRGGA